MILRHSRPRTRMRSEAGSATTITSCRTISRLNFPLLLLLTIITLFSSLTLASQSESQSQSQSHSTNIPIRLPTVFTQSSSAPRSTPAPVTSPAPLLAVPLTPEERSYGFYDDDGGVFPSEPPSRSSTRRNVNNEPLPLSPPGTYLHSAVLLGDEMHIYGGLASYEPERYFNDMWLYDVGDMEYSQLQGSYVPPLPTRAGMDTSAITEHQNFAPADIPSAPGMAAAPMNTGQAVEPLNVQNPITPPSSFLPQREAARPVRVYALEHMWKKDREKMNAAGVDMWNLHQSALRNKRQQPLVAAPKQFSHHPRHSSISRADIQHRASLLQFEQEAKRREKEERRFEKMAEKELMMRRGERKDGKKHHVESEDAMEENLDNDSEELSSESAALLEENEEGADLDSESDASDNASSDSSDGSIFLATKTSVHHTQRMRFLSRTLDAMRNKGRVRARGREKVRVSNLDSTSSQQQPPLHPPQQRIYSNSPISRGGNSGSIYAGSGFGHDSSGADRFPEQGIAADSIDSIQERGSLRRHANGAASEISAPYDSHTVLPPPGRAGIAAGNDHWKYSFTTHLWSLVTINSSKPLIHSPWLLPQQMKYPDFTDPLALILPPTRRLHTAVTTPAPNAKMIIFGGVSSANLILGDVWEYDPKDSSWIEVKTEAKMPILPREGHAAVVSTSGEVSTMYVFGGVSYGFLPFNDLWKYDITEKTWTRLKPEGTTLPMQRWMHTMVGHKIAKESDGEETTPSTPDVSTAGDELIVFGGVTSHYVPLNDIHVYTISSNTWRQVQCQGVPPFPRMLHTAVVVNNIMLVTGGAANNLPLDDLYILDLRTWKWREMLQTSGYPFARTGASLIVLSPRARAKELGETDDATTNESNEPDMKDPHLHWKVDTAKAAARQPVGSFSSDGFLTGVERPSDLKGLNQIAFPKNIAYPRSSQHASGGSGGIDNGRNPRPLFRYRKHAKNDYYLVLFGGATAVQVSEEESQKQHPEQQRDDPYSSAYFMQEAPPPASAASSSPPPLSSSNTPPPPSTGFLELSTSVDLDTSHRFSDEAHLTLVEEDADLEWGRDDLKAEEEEEEEARAAATDDSIDDVDSSFLSTTSTSTQDPPSETIGAHKESLSRSRFERLRAEREQTRRGPTNAPRSSPQGGADTSPGNDRYGIWDERLKSEEAKEVSPETAKGLDAERIKRLGARRPNGMSRAPFCPTYPWCQHTPVPPPLSELPVLDDPERRRIERAAAEPLKEIPIQLAELKKDPKRFGVVFQDIYASNERRKKNRADVRNAELEKQKAGQKPNA